jgi:trehalose 6-phosphate synthase/phosphatase
LLRRFDPVTRRPSDWIPLTNSQPAWHRDVLPIMERYARRTPGAFVEAKDYSIVWHYRIASPYYSQKHLVILRRLLRPLARRYGLVIMGGNKILEIKPADINKGAAVELLLGEYPGDIPPDFILCIGDDATDEDMFAALPGYAYTVKIGRGATDARYRLHSIRDVSPLLEKLAKARRKR